MRIRLLKWLDGVVGGLVAGCLPCAPGRASATEVPRHLLVIRPGGIGDAILLVPALIALKARFPEASLTVLAEKRNGAAFALCPAVDRLLYYDVPADLLRVIRHGFDLAIDTEQWHKLSAVVARLSRASVSIGFASNDRKRLFSHQIGYCHDDYEARSFFNLLAPLGIAMPAVLPAPFLALPGPAAARAEVLLDSLCGTRFVAIFPGASIAQRRWGAERFREVAQRLVQGGFAFVVVGGEDDTAHGEHIAAGLGGLNLAGKTTLAETAAVIARSTLLLSGDSGVLHMAVGLAIPTVSLFGPGIEAKWGPKGEGDTVLNRRLACSPCTRFGTTPGCPRGACCLSEITVAQVVAAVEDVLTGRPLSDADGSR